ncbi:FkbM family methyltransferase [Cyanobium sp. ATX 6E8]|nr:FkbM family methyltransferase [Cyanobium sp. ATX 6E8]
MSSFFRGMALQTKRSRPLRYIASKIPWLDHWNLLSSTSYGELLQERNLRIIGEDDKYVYAKDTCLQYVGPSSSSKIALNAPVSAIRRLSSIANKNGVSYADIPSANALIHNIILRSYREFMPFGNISMRTCDLSVNDIFIDIGCFRGYLSLKASKIVGPNGLVVSVDPIEDSIAILEKQISLNCLDNILPLTRACVSECCNDKTVSFFDAGDGSTNNSIVSHHLSVKTKAREVACISISDILSQIPKSKLEGRRIVASITTNGSEFLLLEELFRRSPISITCCIPTLYTYEHLPKWLPRFRAEFPDALVADSYPWLQVRVEK